MVVSCVNQVPAVLKWNPFSEVPYVTFTNHAGAMELNPEGFAGNGLAGGTVESFLEKFIGLCRMESESHSGSLQYHEGDILIENYAGIAARVFNKAQVVNPRIFPLKRYMSPVKFL